MDIKFSGDTLADIIEQMNALISSVGTPAAETKDEPADEKPPRTAKKEKADEPKDEPADGTVTEDEVEEKRGELRAQLRKYAALTDRKAATKILNKFGESVDEVPADELDDAIEAMEKAIKSHK